MQKDRLDLALRGRLVSRETCIARARREPESPGMQAGGKVEKDEKR